MIKEKKLQQKEFFNQKPAKPVWSNLLVEKGFSWFIKPREKKHFDLIKQFGLKKGDKVLDVGCGTGHFLARLEKEFNIKGTGIDISSNSIKLAKKWQNKNLKFITGEAEKLAFKNKSFDYVLSFDFLEHTNKQNQALKEMARVLKKDGKLLLYTINKKRRFTWNWFLEELGFNLAKLAAHDKNLFLLTEDVEEKLKKLKMKKEKLVLYDSFFCLILNEAMALFDMLMMKLKFEKNKFLGRIFWGLMTLMSKTFGLIFDWLDWPWRKKGLSNSFYFTAKKNV